MKTNKPLCIACHEKTARLGKEDGFPANLYCSMKCGYDEAIITHMDSKLCEVCGEWLEVCGGCDDEE